MDTMVWDIWIKRRNDFGYMHFRWKVMKNIRLEVLEYIEESIK